MKEPQMSQSMPGPPAAAGTEDGHDRLRELGYEQRLTRRLGLAGSIAITLSDITPAGSLLVVGIAVVAVAGTGSALAYLAGCLLAVTVAMCMAELGSMYPIAGGVYSIVSRVVGTPAAFLTLLSYTVQAIFLPASIALGIGTYLHSLNHVFPVNASAAVAMVLVTGLALLRIDTNAIMTGVFLALEIVVVIVIAVAGFSHPAQHFSVFVHPTGLADGKLVSFGAGAVVAAVAIAMQSVNGYDAAIAFAEETKGSSRTVGIAVLLSCVIAVVLEFGAFLGAAVGAPDLKNFLGSDTPLTYVVQERFGHAAGTAISVGAVIAFLNACLAITLQFARVLWASGRDGIWPGPVSRALARIIPSTRAPWVATLVVGVFAVVLCFLSNLVAVVTFVSVLALLLYVFVGVAAVISRLRDRAVQRPFRMPVWPVWPLVAVAGSVTALTQQTHRDLVIVACLYAAGLLYYALYLRRRGAPLARPDQHIPPDVDATTAV
jgi:amino acid transporter